MNGAVIAELPLLIASHESLLRSYGEPVPIAEGRMPGRTPEPGEQYRFHFDMAKCIGCKCCVVACNEQNGNPASINWRRVGEIEGGFFPSAQKAYLSMGCNHCVDPTCLAGCPVDAYTKDAVTGIVLHSADACIGCQYCTWNCSYGVPQYNPDRGVVGKCDMCHGRLSLGQAPACVSACPEGALQIEIVNIAGWRETCGTELSGEARGANLDGPRRHVPPGVPTGDHSLSTTRVTIPVLAPNAKPIDLTHVAVADPHWPLVIMTVLTQMSAGAFVTIWLLQLLGVPSRLDIAAVTSLLIAGLALAASTMHLGRPAYAYRALKMWRRSWLSREVLMFSAFSGIAATYAGALLLSGPAEASPHLGWLGTWGLAFSTWGPALAGPMLALGALTSLLGAAGVTATAYIYRVPSRPAWNTPLTLLKFGATGAVLGPLLAAAAGAGDVRWLVSAAVVMAGVQLLVIAAGFLRVIASERVELRGTARLLSTVLASRFLARVALLVIGGIALPLVAVNQGEWGGWGESGGASVVMTLALLCALGGEILGRYLFFVSVVPSHMAAPYLPIESEAA